MPIIKFYLGSVQFDVLFACVEEPKGIFKMLKQANLTNSEAFKKLTETSQSSLLGRVACQNMVNNVPNRQTFQLVLRTVRFWAFQRGIYSINAGYLGGITIAVMVAKICQEFPELQPACCLHKFFETYAESSWREPVQMSLSNKYKSSRGGSLSMHLIEAVNRYSSDAMVVLTPNDQLQNTSYRVSEHNLNIICQELSKAQKLLRTMRPSSRILHKPGPFDESTSTLPGQSPQSSPQEETKEAQVE